MIEHSNRYIRSQYRMRARRRRPLDDDQDRDHEAEEAKQMKPMGLAIWTVYDRPRDYPDKFVARRFDDGAPSASIIVAPDLQTLRDILQFDLHLVRLARDPEDEPQIVESWL